MKYSMTMADTIYQEICGHIFKNPESENAGFAFARLSKTDGEIRLILREFTPIDDIDVLDAHREGMRIDSAALSRAMKHARLTDSHLVFVHSHPSGFSEFSEADDQNEFRMFEAVYRRNENVELHASLVIPREGDPFARLWLPEGVHQPISRIRVIGSHFRMFDATGTGAEDRIFDRQVLAFGSATQSLLKSLHVAVVGCGGTGSAVAEQLVRLGIGTLSVYDGDKLEGSNVTRVYGSCSADSGIHKVDLCKRNADRIGLGTTVKTYSSFIGDEVTAKSLRDADIVFGCTDDHWGRSILCELSTRYLIPVIDMGVRITSENGIIQSICGRVTTIFPGATCMMCRERISADIIKAEVDRHVNPQEAERLRNEGYAPELGEKDPSVITFTTSVASTAVTELIHRLTGFMGSDRKSTEVIHFFERSEIKTNATPPVKTCSCQNHQRIGVADTRDYLGMTWL